MSGQIIGLAPGLTPTLNPWLEQTASGSVGLAVRQWALERYHHAVQDIFGYHALQLGAPSLNSFLNSRIAHRWIATDTIQDKRGDFFANASALPFFEATLDLVSLPFTLDAHSDPDAVLDEVSRTLVSQGRAIFLGFNACSIWTTMRLVRTNKLPKGAQIYGLNRLRISLAELGLVEESVQHSKFLGSGGKQVWSAFNGLYFLVAKKQVMGVKPIRRKAWRLPSWSELTFNPYSFPNPRGLRSDDKRRVSTRADSTRVNE